MRAVGAAIREVMDGETPEIFEKHRCTGEHGYGAPYHNRWALCVLKDRGRL